MNTMNDKTKRLIAVGASIAANCQQCLLVNIKKARENGCDEQEINEAIEIGKLVSRGAISKMNKVVSNLGQLQSSVFAINDDKCICDS